MIRKYIESDLDSIIQIWLEASIKAHNFIEAEFWKSKTGDMRQIYIPNSETWIYEEDNKIIGFFSLFENTLAAIFVSPEFQGKGIGSKLMEKVKYLRPFLQLTVYCENTDSVEFYKKCGFKIIKEQKDEHTGFSEYLMEFHSQPITS